MRSDYIYGSVVHDLFYVVVSLFNIYGQVHSRGVMPY